MEKYNSLISNEQPYINETKLEIVTSIYNYFDFKLYGFEIDGLVGGIVTISVIISHIFKYFYSLSIIEFYQILNKIYKDV